MNDKLQPWRDGEGAVSTTKAPLLVPNARLVVIESSNSGGITGVFTEPAVQCETRVMTTVAFAYSTSLYSRNCRTYAAPMRCCRPIMAIGLPERTCNLLVIPKAEPSGHNVSTTQRCPQVDSKATSFCRDVQRPVQESGTRGTLPS